MKTLQERLLVGDNAFIGVNHLSQESLRSRQKLDPKEIGEIINIALESGAQGLVCSDNPLVVDALQHLKLLQYRREFGIFLILPDVRRYLEIVSDNGTVGLAKEILGDLSLTSRLKLIVGGGLAAAKWDPSSILGSYLSAQVSTFEKKTPSSSRVRAVLLHEMVTELIVSFNLQSLCRNFIDLASDSLGVMPGFVTRNFASFVKFAKVAGIELERIIVMTPFNKVGFQMNPSLEACEAALASTKDANIIAMSILAGGYLSLAEACQYLESLPVDVTRVIGVSSRKQAEVTFTLARS